MNSSQPLKWLAWCTKQMQRILHNNTAQPARLENQQSTLTPGLNCRTPLIVLSKYKTQVGLRLDLPGSEESQHTPPFVSGCLQTDTKRILDIPTIIKQEAQSLTHRK